MRERLTFNHGAAVLRLEPGPAVPAVERPSRAASSAAQPTATIVRPPRPSVAYWATWFFTALLFFRPQDTLGILEPLHLSDIAAVVGLSALCFQRMSVGLAPIRMTAELAGVLGLAVVMLITMPFSIWPNGALNKFLDVYLKVALIFLLVIHTVRSTDMLRRLVWVMVLAMGYIALRGTFDYARGMNLQEGRLNGPVSGLMGNPNDFAMNMVTFLPFALVAAFGRETPWRRVIAAGTSILMLGIIAFTKSRAGMLGLGLMLFVLVIQAGRLRSSLMFALVIGSLIAIPTAPPNIWQRLSSIVDQEEDETGSREARKLLMVEGWKAFLAHPLTGVGVGQFQNYNPPDRAVMWHETHNVFLQVMAELGIAGGLCFLFLMCATVIALYRTGLLLRRVKKWRSGPNAEALNRALPPLLAERMRLHNVAATAGFAGWFTCAQFASIGYYWTFYYLLAFIVIGREVTRERVAAAQKAALANGPAAP